jgi:hypothetical protein
MVNFMVDKMKECSQDIPGIIGIFIIVYSLQVILVLLDFFYDNGVSFKSKHHLLLWLSPFAIPVAFIIKFWSLK